MMDYITDLCENKIAVSCDVETEMKRLRTKAKLDLSFIPFYKMSQSCFKMYFHCIAISKRFSLKWLSLTVISSHR